ncbi:MAG: insulinase family protein [Candidatus Omnitrophica bacterium]|nr:insulinase family protein [Candidatus Omnitrophota bacterium]
MKFTILNSRKAHSRIFLFAFVLLLTCVAGAEKNPYETQKAVLDNGAAIVCRYVPDSPLVTVQIRVLSGLSSEGEYAGSGVSHFLEHLVFKGTRDKTSGEIFKEIRQMGGIVNASTGLDSAEFHITVPNENFAKGLDLLTDMVMDPVFSDRDMRTEKEVILKEIKLHEDNPGTERIWRLFSRAYMEHIYKYPVIGYTERFKALTREDILRYHKDTYTPGRMVMGIVGGVPPEAALETAKNKLKRYERGKPRFSPALPEPEQLCERTARFPADTDLGYLAMGFHAASLFSADIYPLDVLSILLGGGRDSRLYERLVRDRELLYAVSCSNPTPRYPGLFVITGIGEPDKLAEARREIFGVLEELRAGGVHDAEMERARNIVSAGYLYSNERIEGMVSFMTASQLLTGDPFFYETYVEGIKNTRKEQVEKAGSRYLNIDNSTTVTLVPKDFKEEQTEAKKEAEGEEGEERSITLENGLKAVVKRRARLPLVSVCIAFPGGVRAENAEDNGISGLTASLVLKGTDKRDEGEIVPVIERIGGSIRAFSGRNSLGVSMSLLSKDLDKGLDILEDVIKNPTFPPEEIEKRKKKITASIRIQEKDIFEKGMFELRELLYGEHPYAMRTEGGTDTVDRISREEIRGFYKRHFSPEKAVLTIVGDIDIEEAVEKISAGFGNWKGDGDEVLTEAVKPLQAAVREELTMEKEQSLLLIGFQGVDIHDDRKYALSMIGTMLSGGGGILFKAVREEQGLAYSCGAASVALVDPGYFVLYVKTTEKNIRKVKRSAFDVIKKIRKRGISEDDINAARNRMLTGYASSV